MLEKLTERENSIVRVIVVLSEREGSSVNVGVGPDRVGVISTLNEPEPLVVPVTLVLKDGDAEALISGESLGVSSFEAEGIECVFVSLTDWLQSCDGLSVGLRLRDREGSAECSADELLLIKCDLEFLLNETVGETLSLRLCSSDRDPYDTEREGVSSFENVRELDSVGDNVVSADPETLNENV